MFKCYAISRNVGLLKRQNIFGLIITFIAMQSGTCKSTRGHWQLNLQMLLLLLSITFIFHFWKNRNNCKKG